MRNEDAEDRSPPLRVFRFSEPGLSRGVQAVKLDGVDARIYGPAKTVVDAARAAVPCVTEGR